MRHCEFFYMITHNLSDVNTFILYFLRFFRVVIFVFYDRYVSLCESIGKKPYTVAKELGLGNSNVAQWKKGSTPRGPVVQLMSAYFGVPVSFLLVGDEKKPTAISDGELSPAQQEAIDFVMNMDEETLIRFIKAAKAMLGE